ncbi:MAG TPA: pyridoxal 5'-phosphate synthase lyase subunit PdxS, partial [Gordonia polyisoprenivorans]|nr:pyridoxal 5'-phosphate synthase lyase subunit PdxS [Gordonia polyisoprenivorans]
MSQPQSGTTPGSDATSAINGHHGTPESGQGTARVKRGMAEMLKGGVIMDV